MGLARGINELFGAEKRAGENAAGALVKTKPTRACGVGSIFSQTEETTVVSHWIGQVFQNRTVAGEAVTDAGPVHEILRLLQPVGHSLPGLPRNPDLADRESRVMTRPGISSSAPATGKRVTPHC